MPLERPATTKLVGVTSPYPDARADAYRTPIFLDVDTGIDDSLALAYLFSSPEAQIIGIACTAGNVPTDRVVANNLAWLDLWDAIGIDVAKGAAGPLEGELNTAEDTHGEQGVGYARLPRSLRQISRFTAAQAWVQAARRRPGDVVGLITGPMTNLALAIRLEPRLPQLLKRLVIMGGAFDHPGNTTPTAEWNVWVDPEAAKEVFDAYAATPGATLPVVCPLDLTETMIMTPQHLQRIALRAGSKPIEFLSASDPLDRRSEASIPVIRHLTDALRFYFEFHDKQGLGYFAQMHDPFAAAITLHPEMATYQPATVDVELSGTLTRGATIADRRGFWGRPPNAYIATTADSEAFFNHLIERVGETLRSRYSADR